MTHSGLVNLLTDGIFNQRSVGHSSFPKLSNVPTHRRLLHLQLIMELLDGSYGFLSNIDWLLVLLSVLGLLWYTLQ